MTPRAGPFADALLVLDLPALPEQRRRQTVGFVERRLASLPDPVALGVSCAAFAVRAAGRLAGHQRVARFLGSHQLPVLGEYARLVRSLGYAYIWETWPATRPDGAPG